MKTVIIGAGAAGLTAASQIKNGGILVLEKNEKPGKKLYITGKGRCNVTNECGPSEFIEKVNSNPKFLTSAINAFSPRDAIEFLEQNGCPTVTERGNRVFPASQKASDVTKALVRAAENAGAQIMYNTAVKSVSQTENGFAVLTSAGEIFCDNLIIATGGLSYPSTGSTGDGYKFAAALGHTVVPPVPSLVRIDLKEDVSALTGLSLKNVGASVKDKRSGKVLFSQFGELLFTDAGVSGPAVLTLSAKINRADPSGLLFCIDLKPALTPEKLDKRVLSDFSAVQNRALINSLSDLLPKSLIPYIIDVCGLVGASKVNSLTRAERALLVDGLKNLTFNVKALGGFSSAVVTAGGVSVREVCPQTMQSKLVKGLYFAGEILDVDALTGGFNIQTALSTGFLAGRSI
ncbi:MAG: NAD(P)/FAD-dependent oxidoreductase [Clostridiales bacterium]|jgi:predicted Rossmann fold flavoprotein|nr:NAD(P)/FAD-dependent oxidoreductase [Clostridiales bacterium]